MIIKNIFILLIFMSIIKNIILIINFFIYFYFTFLIDVLNEHEYIVFETIIFNY